MIQTGICPKCNELLEKVKIEVIKIEWARKSHDGISYVCPKCAVILSVSVDPYKWSEKLLEGVKKLLPK